MCQRLVCQKREFAARSSSYEVSRCVSLIKDPKFKYEIFMRIDMKHSYISYIRQHYRFQKRVVLESRSSTNSLPK